MKQITVAVLTGLSKAFLSLKTPEDLEDLLGISVMNLTALSVMPRYNEFTVPKRAGGLRLIEDPNDALQAVQSTLNDFLQAVYWKQRSPAAYGFLVVPKDDPAPRHIETNAAQHLGRDWLLNCDLQDFFHQITRERLLHLFSAPPFDFDDALCQLLANLCTFKGRCPMGAPTSPVLSNLVFAPTDQKMLELAGRKGWVYTRYADDMSFSSLEPIDWDAYSQIQNVAAKNDFDFNPAKAVLYTPADPKIITGLLLGDGKIELPVEFIPNLAEDIRQLEGAMRVHFRVGQADTRPIRQFRKSLEGRIRFAERILGVKHPAVKTVWKNYRDAVRRPRNLEARSWLDFDYF